MKVGRTSMRIIARIARLYSRLTRLPNLILRRGKITDCWIMSMAGFPSSTTVMAARVEMAGARIRVSRTRLAAK